MSNNPRHQWRVGNLPPEGNYRYDSPSHSQQPSLPPITYPPIQPGPPPNPERQPISTLQNFQPHVLSALQPTHAQDGPFRPSIHQPILAQANPTSRVAPTEVIEVNTPPINSASVSPSIGNYRPLNVRDALSYLDRVKIEFQNQPEIYNRFLDIMKEFKSQSIDTPGVIERVSSLFRGYPSLVIGFNTFLPPGFRIEISSDPNDLNGVRVIVPDQAEPIVLENREHYPNLAIRELPNSGSYYAQPGYQQISGLAQANPLYTQPSQTFSEAPNTTTNNSTLQGTTLSPTQQRKPPVEFNHAINYVNRIKNRFSRDPESYKQFLDILQLYQKDAKPITEIYAQVRELFGNDQDLLDEFCQFLPDTSSRNQELASGGLTSRPTSSQFTQPLSSALATSIATLSQSTRTASGNYPLGSIKPNGSLHSRDFISTNLSGPIQVEPLTTLLPHTAPMLNENVNSGFTMPSPPMGSSKKKRGTALNDKVITPLKAKKSKPGAKNKDINGASPKEQAAQIEAQFQEHSRALIPSDDINSFEKAKRHIGHLPTYYEFLKVINLYSQGIIEIDTLVETAENFIGNNTSLFAWFKEFVGYVPKQEPVQIEAIPKPKLDLSQFKAFGPSYRQLPKSETQIKCSGRDELCNEVLNNNYASHPTWASEETVFVAHKKNIYEENLHKSEEDRFELDFNMETNAHTIALLEPIAKQIAKMPADSLASFKLPPGLGGYSQTIYKRALRKVYDTEAQTVLDYLHDSPGTAVPVVLRRLKQKDKEWREVKREWSKIWKDVDVKNYYRSLDYQTAQFKYNDRKNVTPRHLVTEIEAIKLERGVKGATAPQVPKDNSLGLPQLSYVLEDDSIHKDIGRLLFYLLETHNGFSLSEKKRMIIFLKAFVNDVFMVPFMEHIDAQLIDDTIPGDEFEDNDSSKDSEIDVSSTTSKRQTRSGKINHDSLFSPETKHKSILSLGQSRDKELSKVKISDVGKDKTSDIIKDKASELVKDKVSDTTKDMASDTVKDKASDVKDKPSNFAQEPIKASPPKNSEIKKTSAEKLLHEITSFSQIRIDPEDSPDYSDDKKGSIFMFANNHIYALIRIYQIMHQRLKDIKSSSEKVNLKFKNMATSKTACRELELQPKFEALADIDLTKEDSYQVFLNFTERVLDADIEPPVYEDCLRFIFGNQVYIIFTLDKILNGFLKQVHTLFIELNKNSLELVNLFQSQKQGLGNRLKFSQVKDYLGQAVKSLNRDENLHIIEYTLSDNKLSFQLFNQSELTVERIQKIETSWQSYINSYKSLDPTQGVKITRPTFLKRLIRSRRNDDQENPGVCSFGLNMKIRPITLKIDTDLEHNEESFLRFGKKHNSRSRNKRKEAKWYTLLNGPNGWSRNVSNPEKEEARTLDWLNEGKTATFAMEP